MRLLLINPNTTASITDKVVAVARTCVAGDVEIRAETGRFGARYISSRSAAASPATTVNPRCAASNRWIAARNSRRSAWTRGPCTALPLERLSMR